MARRSSVLPTALIFPTTDWDPESKELWHYNFEKEIVNDGKWSCLVAATIPAEAQEEEVIQTYDQCVKTGLRNNVKTISMADVIKLLKESNSVNNIINKKEDKNLKPEKQERRNSKSPSLRSSQIVELAAKYTIILDFECKLPPDLMAAVLKHMILKFKDEYLSQKKVDAAKQKKLREQNLKEKFIRELKPYEVSQEEKKSQRKFSGNILESEEPIDDELVEGPDLYILLMDFYDPAIFPELLRMNVPFLAFLKIAKLTDKKYTSSISLLKSDLFNKKKALISSFWEKLNQENITPDKTNRFKDIAVLQYNAISKPSDPNLQYYRFIYDEITYMLYSVYRIYKQHQKYLTELNVQRLIMALEPLDLARCEMYNKLCDAFVTGEPLTPLLVLYALVEQVVAGVPETESVALEYKPQLYNYFPTTSESNSPILEEQLVTPCKTCRDKKYENICEKLKTALSDNLYSQKSEWTEHSEQSSVLPQIQFEGFSSEISEKSENFGNTDSSESIISELLIDQVMSEKKTEREMRKEKNYKTPSLCFYGDSVALQTYFCDPRLLDSKSLVDRFLTKLVLQIWRKYPELPPGEQAFKNFHFFRLWKSSGENEELLKQKIYFAMIMKLIGVSKSYLFKGEEDSMSEMLSSMDKEKPKTPRAKLERPSGIINDINNESFEKFFLKTFIDKVSLLAKEGNKEKLKEQRKKFTSVKIDSQTLHAVLGHFSMTKQAKNNSMNCSSSYSFQEENEENLHSSKQNTHKNSEKMPKFLQSLLDNVEISDLIEEHFLPDKENYTTLLRNFKFYEKLKPHLMIQRVIEAQANFNTAQYSYFPPTDTILIMMHNDVDYRGIFYMKKQGTLSTPVTLREFYSHVYSEIKEWVAKENDAHLKHVSEIREKLKEKQEKKELKYLAQLKRQYCEMSEEKRQEFLENKIEVQLELEELDKGLDDSSEKPKSSDSYKMSLSATNLTDLRVESNQKLYEFYSLDGTEVNVSAETWLHSAPGLLKLKIKKSSLLLYFNQCLEGEADYSFTLKTTSDMIFAFSKNDFEEMNNFFYRVNISWPTGLLIQPIHLNSSIYIKQGYLKPYRRGWDIEEENSRCFLRNGQVIIFKENGSYDILCGTGTKYIFYESAGVPKYDVISTTGEIWEFRTRGPCKNKKKLIGSNKIFIGVDPKTQEIFYKREDGVSFMLWPSGTLVTNYTDGTKITSTPFFEENEVTVEWTEEEKLLFEEIEPKHKSEISFQERRSKTILRNSSAPKSIERKSFINEGFVSVSCLYLIEHPKYSSVYFSPEDPFIKLTMPEQLSVYIYSEGTYEIHKERESLEVCGSKLRFSTTCCDCKNQSTTTIVINSNKVLCKTVDFFKKAFLVFLDGSTAFTEHYAKLDEDDEDEDDEFMKVYSKPVKIDCPTDHKKNSYLAQRCFALKRDLSGVEFIHADSFACYCYNLPEETCFDINTDDPLYGFCTFSSPYCKIGYEKWVMDYENNENTRPTNLKKKDLKELGTKDTPKNFFQHPFPQQKADRQESEKVKRNFDMPKVIIGRTINCMAQEPESVLMDLKKYIAAYQERNNDMCKELKCLNPSDDRWRDSRYVAMRLRKIAVTLNQSLHMYPHLCTQLPSTEKDIHYFGHFINSMENLKSHFQDRTTTLPDCKQIPQPLPELSAFPCIQEENESSNET